MSSLLNWTRLPPLPDTEGFAGMYAGVSDEALIVAGGTNFPRAPIWEGGQKIWHECVFVLDKPNGQWRTAKETLPRPLAYGISATWKGTVICAGGSDSKRHYSDVFALRLVDGRIQTEPLPPLPRPCADMCGILLGSQLYVAGGTDRPNATTGLHTFWTLDLSRPKDSLYWEELEPWPGPERSHAVAATVGDSFYLISGFRWKPGHDGAAVPVTPFLVDAYRYSPQTNGKGTWKRIADVPRAVGAAPSPAMTLNASRIAVIGGIDHTLGDHEPATHPGFPLDVTVYDPSENSWKWAGKMPNGNSRVTAPSTLWDSGYVVVGGERAPARRSPDLHVARSELDTDRYRSGR